MHRQCRRETFLRVAPGLVSVSLCMVPKWRYINLELVLGADDLLFIARLPALLEIESDHGSRKVLARR